MSQPLKEICCMYPIVALLTDVGRNAERNTIHLHAPSRHPFEHALGLCPAAKLLTGTKGRILRDDIVLNARLQHVRQEEHSARPPTAALRDANEGSVRDAVGAHLGHPHVLHYRQSLFHTLAFLACTDGQVVRSLPQLCPRTPQLRQQGNPALPGSAGCAGGQGTGSCGCIGSRPMPPLVGCEGQRPPPGTLAGAEADGSIVSDHVRLQTALLHPQQQAVCSGPPASSFAGTKHNAVSDNIGLDGVVAYRHQRCQCLCPCTTRHACSQDGAQGSSRWPPMRLRKYFQEQYGASPAIWRSKAWGQDGGRKGVGPQTCILQAADDGQRLTPLLAVGACTNR
mmetsp:Transcript_87377/g.271464  ORF Transcript_87377/g.271464 Transcript_87377/m.271464 type:complete len:339 (-) Transcript_87377:283-1299(-)